MATGKKRTVSGQTKKAGARGKASASAKKKTESAQNSAPAPAQTQAQALDGSVSHLIHRAEQCSTDLFGSMSKHEILAHENRAGVTKHGRGDRPAVVPRRGTFGGHLPLQSPLVWKQPSSPPAVVDR